MADGVQVEFTGLVNMNRNLSKFSRKLQIDVEVPAIRAAAKTIRDIARTMAPIGKLSDVWGKDKIHRSGSLKRAISHSASAPRNPMDDVRGRVFVRSGTFENPNAAYYGGMVEGGHWVTKPRKRGLRESVRAKRTAARMKYVAPQPFMRPAVDTGKGMSFNAAALEARKRFDMAVRGSRRG